MSKSAIINTSQIGSRWPTSNPFLLCVYHIDLYPKGDSEQGLGPSSIDRTVGSDFSVQNGYSMYHGETVPGFPAHPHRGFETVTITHQGVIDHFDSLGGHGRYSSGDVQWMTAGSGLQHSEMFPLTKQDEDNTLELFQIWLNLPKKNKFVEPEYKMLWHEDLPVVVIEDKNNIITVIDVIAGRWHATNAIKPTDNSWAATADNEVCIFTLKINAGGAVTLPLASALANRSLYFYSGTVLQVNGSDIATNHCIELNADVATKLVNKSDGEIKLLLLQGRPINEPMAQYGPFVMNTENEIHQAINDYNRTQFGGWPWESNAPVNDISAVRFSSNEPKK